MTSARSRIRNLPAALWICMALAGANGLAWSVITPPFQVVDEQSHLGYAQYLVERGRPPIPSPFYAPSAEILTALDALPFTVTERMDFSSASEARYRRELDGPIGRVSENNAAPIANNPPLYYVLVAIPYAIGYDLDVFDRLVLMRLLSPLLFAATVGLIFLFLRETLPRTPWAWTVGALSVAFQPVAAWLAGGVNADNLLAALSAGLLFTFARGFRRGLDTRLAVAIGGLLAAGMLTKGSWFGLLPGAAIGLLVLLRRRWIVDRGAARRAALAAAGCAVVPFAAWLLLNAVAFDRPAATNSGNFSNVIGQQDPSLRQGISYLWQFYLPPLSFMQDAFGYNPLRLTFFEGFVGRFGFAQWGFPVWVYDRALQVAAGLLALLGVELVRRRRALRARLPELAVYATLTLGLLGLIHVAGYLHRLQTGAGLEQPRYLFPLLGLYALALALAARGAGARLGPPVGAAIVMLCFASNLFAQLLSVGRYYA